MSIERCDKHDRHYDTDKVLTCIQCDDDLEAENERLRGVVGELQTQVAAWGHGSASASDALEDLANMREYAEQLKRERDDACEGARALNAEANKWKLLVDDALPIVQRYAYENPCWTNGIGPTQDPQGAHAWLAAVAALSKNTQKENHGIEEQPR